MCLYSSMQNFMTKILILGVDFDQCTQFDFSFDFAKSGGREINSVYTKSAYKSKSLGQRCSFVLQYEFIFV